MVALRRRFMLRVTLYHRPLIWKLHCHTVRYAGFRLIEAGLDAEPSEDGAHSLPSYVSTADRLLALANILELSSKVGMSFADAESDLADEILTNAASVSQHHRLEIMHPSYPQYERSLSRISEGEDTSNAKNRARAFVTYYTSRMDAVSSLTRLIFLSNGSKAWKQNNLDVASYMMRKIEGAPNSFHSLPPLIVPSLR